MRNTRGRWHLWKEEDEHILSLRVESRLRIAWRTSALQERNDSTICAHVHVLPISRSIQTKTFHNPHVRKPACPRSRSRRSLSSLLSPVGSLSQTTRVTDLLPYAVVRSPSQSTSLSCVLSAPCALSPPPPGCGLLAPNPGR